MFISCKESNPIFDENNAFDYLLKQCDFGPRNPGSEGYFKCRDFMIAELKKSTDTVITQNFIYTDEKEGISKSKPFLKCKRPRKSTMG